jgi:hypothetical protein
MTYRGGVNTNAAGHLAGWCVNLDDPTATVHVQVYWGDRLLKRVETYGLHEPSIRDYGNPNAAFYFSFHGDVISRLPAGTQLRVTAPDGTDLPLNKAGRFAPTGTAVDDGAELNDMLNRGYVVDKWGALKLPFRAMDAVTRSSHASALGRATTYFREKLGLTLFPHYGTLLGHARSGTFLPHDDDTDTSFVIESSDIAFVSNSFLDIAQSIHDDGLMVRMVSVGQFAMYFPDNQKIGTDVFCSWHNPETSEFATYFGVHGVIEKSLEFSEKTLEGVSINVPDACKEILALTYGKNWIEPDPSFSWNRRISELEPVMNPLREAAKDRYAKLESLVLTRR